LTEGITEWVFNPPWRRRNEDVTLEEEQPSKTSARQEVKKEVKKKEVQNEVKKHPTKSSDQDKYKCAESQERGSGCNCLKQLNKSVID